MKKTLLALTAAFAVCLCVPAAAETFVSSDGVLSIELPGDNWKEVTDPTKWIALSDGDNVITIDHFSNGEKLPEISVANDYYIDVYQAIFSTQNEVFIITGSVVDKEEIPGVTNSIISAKVLKYDTKLAVKKNGETGKDEYTVAPLNKTMYVTSDGLNVRAGCSTTEQIIGSFEYGEAVNVIGSVLLNGNEIGWYQVALNSGTGYVSSEFLSDKAPGSSSGDKKDDKNDASKTGAVKTVYDEGGNSFTLYEGTDGYWRDKEGTAYTRVSDTEFQVVEGTKRVSVNPPSSSTDTGNSITVYDEFGEAYTLYEGTDGYWRDSSGTAYTWVSDSQLQVVEGTKRVSVNPPSTDDDDQPSDTGNTVTVYDEFGDSYTLYEGTDGYWRDSSGTAYTWVSDSELQVVEGTKRVSVYAPNTNDDDIEPEPSGGGVMTVYDENGESFTLYQDTDGNWRDDSGTEYTWVSDSELQVVEGTKRVSIY